MREDDDKLEVRREVERAAVTGWGERLRRFRVVHRLLRAEAYYLAALAAFAVLTLLAYRYAYFEWDLRLALFVQSLPMEGFMRAVSSLGDGWTPVVITGLTMFAFLAFRRRSEALLLLLSSAGSALVTRFIKATIARPRPDATLVSVLYESEQFSFPSGHVTFYVCFFGFLFFVFYALLPRGSLLRRASLVAVSLPIVLVGFSRVYLGAHWPSDTLGAYLGGGLWLALCLDLYRRRKQRKAPGAQS